jgi:hypothetical protein
MVNTMIVVTAAHTVAKATCHVSGNPALASVIPNSRINMVTTTAVAGRDVAESMRCTVRLRTVEPRCVFDEAGVIGAD